MSDAAPRPTLLDQLRTLRASTGSLGPGGGFGDPLAFGDTGFARMPAGLATAEIEQELIAGAGDDELVAAYREIMRGGHDPEAGALLDEIERRGLPAG